MKLHELLKLANDAELTSPKLEEVKPISNLSTKKSVINKTFDAVQGLKNKFKFNMPMFGGETKIRANVDWPLKQTDLTANFIKKINDNWTFDANASYQPFLKNKPSSIFAKFTGRF